MAYQGHLDWPRGRDLVGWAYDPERPGHRVGVEIRLDGAILRSRIASNFRADLKQAGIGDGSHAFSVELPDSIFDGLPHRIEALADGAGFLSIEYRSIYQGAIDDVSQQAVRFTIRDESQPGLAVVGELYADGRFLTSGSGPEFAIPRGFDVTKVRRLELRARGCSQCVAEWVVADPPVFRPIVAVDGPIDVVVNSPVGTTFTALLRTLESIAASSNEAVTEVYAESEHRDALEEAQQRLGFRIGVPPSGSGHDMVFLAAGALVYGSWLDRLRAVAYADESIATVSPLTGGPIDGLTAREFDALAFRTQPECFAVVDVPSYVCHYKRASGGTVHLLASGVRVESLHPVPPQQDRNPAAARLRRAVEEFRLAENPPVSVQADGSFLVGGLRYTLPEDLAAFSRVAPRGLTVDTALAPLELAGSGIPYQVEVKDYSWICPRGDLIDETGRYCGEPSIEACERCLRKLGPGDGLGGLLHRLDSVAELRMQSRKLLEAATLVKFPSEDAAERVARYCSPRKTAITAGSAKAWAKPTGKSRLRIRRLGEDTAIWQACSWDAKKRELPLEFVIYGEAHAEWLASESPAVSVSEFTLYPIQFAIGAIAPGALQIPCGLPASRINDHLLQGLT